MRKVVFFLTLLFCGLSFFLSPSSAKAQLGDGYANSGQACSGLVCGCQNRGSALGKTCPQGLTAMQVNCTGSDLSGGLCETNGLNPKITKCVNASCPNASDCGCSHEACANGICGCNNIGSATGNVCSDPGLINTAVSCSGSEFMGGQCDSYVGAATINKCVNPSCTTDPDCICDGLPVEPTPPDSGNVTPTPTPTTVPGCFSDCAGGAIACPGGTVCHDFGGGVSKCVNPNANPDCPADDGDCWCAEPCGCSALPESVFNCPEPDPRQPGKIEGPVFGGGEIPACFICDDASFPDCSKLGPVTPPVPTVRYDELNGNRCVVISPPLGSIGSDFPPSTCECEGEICCPTCAEPIVVGGTCDAGCNIDFAGPEIGGGCACFGDRCNEMVIESNPGYTIDFGTSGGVESPDASCVKFPNAGVKIITISCPGGRTCSKEFAIACNCDEQIKPTPATAGSYLYTSWYKLKDDQFHKLDTINDPIPDPVSPYDDDDAQEAPDPACDTTDPTDIRCFNLNQAGIVTSLGDPINTNGAPISHRQWNRTVYSKNTQYTPESFLDYALARKPVNVIGSTAELSSLAKDKINILNSDLTIEDNTQQGNDIIDILEDPARAPYVLIIRGDLTVDHNINVPEPVTESPLPIAFIVEGGEGGTGDLKIHHAVQTMGGVYIADTLDFSYDSESSPYPLKIKGNIISYAAANPLKRNRVDDQTKPSVFVVFDPIVYLNIMDLLSVRTYDWTELAP